MKTGAETTARLSKILKNGGVLVLLALLPYAGYAQETYTAVNDGNWSNPNTWSPDGVPADRDVAVIESPRTVTLDGDVTIDGLTIRGGTLEGSGELIITDFFNWIGGNLGGDVDEVNIHVILPEQSGGIWDGSTKNLNARIDNEGTIQWQEGGISTRITGLGILNNEGTFEAEAAANANFIRFFNHSGATVVKSTSGSTIFSSGLFENQGSVDLRAGSLDIRGSTTLPDPVDTGSYLTQSGTELIFRSANRSFDESAVIQSNGQVTFFSGSNLIKGFFESPNTRINGGTLDFDTGSIMALPQLTINGGTLTGVDEIQLTGNSEWISGATIENAGLIIDEGVTFTISGGGSKQLNTSLTNNGTIDWTAGNWGTSSAGLGTVFNNGSGEIIISGDGSASFLDIRNFGTINRNSSTGQASIVSGFFQNESSGTVHVNRGTLRIGGSTSLDTPSDEGDYQIASGATLRLQQNRELSSGSAITGDRLWIDNGTKSISGTLDVSTVDVDGVSANLTLTGSSPYSIPELNMAGSTLSAVVPLAVSDAMTWTQGAIEGPGEITISGSGGMLIEGTSNRNLNGTVINEAVTTWSGGRINSSTTGGGEFVNNGEFRIETNEEFSRAIFTNNRILRKASGGEAGFTISRFVNSGDVEIESGTLRLNTSSALSTPVDDGVYTLAAGTSLQIDGAPRQLSPDGVIRGPGTITSTSSDLIDNRGTHSPGNSTGIMIYNGEFSMDAASAEITIVLNGSTPGSGHDQLQITESAFFNLGTLRIDLASGYSPSVGDEFQIITYGRHEGEFEEIELPELSGGLEFDVTFESDGLILTVIDPSPNAPPFFTETFDEVTITEGDEFSFQFEADDPDGDELTFSLTEGNDVENASITTGGLFTFNPDPGQAGSYDFTVRVSDGDLFDNHDFMVNVEAVNQAPVFESDPVTIAQVGEPYEYNVVASDRDGDAITLTASTLPGWLNFTDNGDGTGLLEGTPSGSDAGDHDVVLSASDGEETTTQEFTIEVREEPNEPPVFTTTFDEQTLSEGDEFSFQFEADDPDGDDLVFSLTDGEDVENASITQAGLFTFNPDFGQAGSYDFTVRVSDGEQFDEHDFTISVEEVNRPPEIVSSFPDLLLVESGAAYQADPDTVFSDPDGDTLTYTAESSDESVAAVTINELLSVEPVSPGTAVIMVTADDGRGGTVSDQFVVSVEPDEGFDPPVAENLTEVTWMNLSVTIDLSEAVSHPQNRPVSVVETESPTVQGGISEISGDLTIRYTPANGFTGEENFTYTVRDDLNREASASISVDVNTILFELTDLGDLGGGASVARGLNDHGQVVGVSLNNAEQIRAFMWSDDALTELSTGGAADMQAYAVNNSGTIAGYTGVSDTEGSAFRADDNEAVLIPALSGNFSAAYAINENGVIAGVSELEERYVSFGWDNNFLALSAPEGVLSIAYTLSEENVPAGLVQDQQGVVRGYRANELGPQNSRIYAMNSSGFAAGSSDNRPMIWPAGEETQILGGMGEIYSVNSSEWLAGVVIEEQVKWAGFAGFGIRFHEPDAGVSLHRQAARGVGGNETVASLWIGSEQYNLNDRVLNADGWELIEAAAINEAGQIAGTARVNGKLRAFLLTPVDNDGFEDHMADSFEMPGDDSIYLHQNYPNPFNPATVIQFDLAESSRVTLSVYDLLGRRVAALIDETRESGSHEVQFDGSSLSSGVYFYRLRTDYGVRVRKLTLIK